MAVGTGVGDSVGDADGTGVGDSDGTGVGDTDGTGVGDSVGAVLRDQLPSDRLFIAINNSTAAPIVYWCIYSYNCTRSAIYLLR